MANDRSRSTRGCRLDAVPAALRHLLIVNQYRAPEIGPHLRNHRGERPLEPCLTLFEQLPFTGELHPGLDPEATTVEAG